jgi:hypothetical protein
MMKKLSFVFLSCFLFLQLHATTVSFSGYVKSQQSVPLDNYWVFFRFSAPAYLPEDFYINGPAIQTDHTGKYTFSLFNIPSNILYYAKIYVYDSNFNRVEKSFSFYADGCSYNVYTIYTNPITNTNTKVNFNHQGICMDCPAYRQMENTSTANLKNSSMTGWEWSSNSNLISTDTHTKFFVATPDNNQVTLTAKVTDPYTNFTFVSESKTLQVIPDSGFFFHVGGQIFSGSIPVTTSGVVLYRKILDDYEAIDTMIVSQYGYYYFTDLPDCSYLIKAFPDPDLTRNEFCLPTYLPNVPYWNQAQVVRIQNHSSTMTINLLPSISMSGPYKISGNIFLPDLTPVRCEMLLLDSEMNVAQYILTGHEGEFEFSNLPEGIYYLVYEIPGLHAEHIPVSLSVDNPNHYQNIIIGSPAAMDFDNVSARFSVFPNPFISEISISFNKDRPSENQLVCIRNSQGSVLYALMDYTGSQTLVLQLSELPAGQYFIEVFDSGTLTKQVLPIIKM